MRAGGLSGVRPTGNGIVFTAVVAGRSGDCDAVQILVGASDLRAALQAMRRYGYRAPRPRPGRLQITAEDAELGGRNPGVVFERVWLQDGSWHPADAAEGD
jgi:hypothetical protein